jgi:hypothetical protein
MDMSDLPEVIAAFAMFGLVVVCPLVYMLMRHQRAMAELIHGRPTLEAEQRIAALEHEVMMLRATQQQQALRDLEHKELGSRPR